MAAPVYSAAANFCHANKAEPEKKAVTLQEVCTTKCKEKFLADDGNLNMQKLTCNASTGR